MTKQNVQIKKATFTAVMAALGCALAYVPRLFTADSGGRLDLAILPILFVAQLCGPVWSMLGYGLTDLVGCLFSGYAPFLPITVCKLIAGLLLGICFYKKKFEVKRCLVSFAVLAFVVDIPLMTVALKLLQGRPWIYYVWVRPLTAALNFAVRVVFALVVGNAAKAPLARVSKQFEKENAFMRYANSFQAVPRLGLERISHLLSLLGDPQKDGRFIHIAGTNGKGSVSMACASVLCEAGYKTGLYISPNLCKVNERISIDGAQISDEDLEKYMKRVEEAAEKTQQDIREIPSQFELWTACAFLYYKEQDCDYVVLETGLGGEFDATNVIDSNEIAVLVSIDYDHTALLGNTKEEIARTKCGIFKENCRTKTVISAPQDEAVKAVILEEAEKKGLSVSFATPPAPDMFASFYEVITYKDFINLPLPFAGVHQIENMCVALDVLKALGIENDAIKDGFAFAKHPARMELLREDPPLLYDGAHNPAGIEALCTSLERYAKGTKWAIIFAAMADKDIAPSLRRLAPFADRFIFTTVQGNSRAYTPEALAKKAAECGVVGTPCESLRLAITLCEDVPTLVCGSLYLYADL